MDRIDELWGEIGNLLPEVDERIPEPKSFEEFKESCRRAHSEPRCKSYRAVALESGLEDLPSGILAVAIDRAWEEAYIEYLEDQLEHLKWAKENPLIVGMVHTLIDKGMQNLAKSTPFQGESMDFEHE